MKHKRRTTIEGVLFNIPDQLSCLRLASPVSPSSSQATFFGSPPQPTHRRGRPCGLYGKLDMYKSAMIVRMQSWMQNYGQSEAGRPDSEGSPSTTSIPMLRTAMTRYILGTHTPKPFEMQGASAPRPAFRGRTKSQTRKVTTVYIEENYFPSDDPDEGIDPPELVRCRRRAKSNKKSSVDDGERGCIHGRFSNEREPIGQ